MNNNVFEFTVNDVVYLFQHEMRLSRESCDRIIKRYSNRHVYWAIISLISLTLNAATVTYIILNYK